MVIFYLYFWNLCKLGGAVFYFTKKISAPNIKNICNSTICWNLLLLLLLLLFCLVLFPLKDNLQFRDRANLCSCYRESLQVSEVTPGSCFSLLRPSSLSPGLGVGNQWNLEFLRGSDYFWDSKCGVPDHPKRVKATWKLWRNEQMWPDLHFCDTWTCPFIWSACSRST